MGKRLIGTCVLLVFLPVLNGLATVQVVDAKKGLLKLSPEIEIAGEATIPENPISISDLSEQSFPLFVSFQHPDWGIALTASKFLHVFDPSCLTVLRSLPLPDVFSIVRRLPGSDDFVIGQRMGGTRVLSRADLTTGKTQWTIDYDFINQYFHETSRSRSLGRYLGRHGGEDILYYHFSSPTRVSYSEQNDQLIFTGLTLGTAKSSLSSFFSSKDIMDWGNRILVVDAATGKILQDEKFDLQRNINDQFIFISLERNEFKVLDVQKGEITQSGKFDPGDVLVKKGYTPPVDVTAANRELIMDSDIHAIQTENGLLLVSHEWAKTLTAPKLKALWLKYDSDGKRVGLVTPPPLTSPSFLVRNQGEDGWPIILLGIKNKSLGPKAEHLVIVKKDGSLSEVPMPKPKANMTYDVFHDGQNLYSLAGGPGPRSLYRGAIGEENAVSIWKIPPGNDYESAPAGYKDLIVLKGDKGAAIFHLTDGSPVSPEEALQAAPPGLYWELSEADRSAKPLPKSELPPAFNKYVNFHRAEPYLSRNERSNLLNIPTLRLWGEDIRKDLGDILLAPALLKDSSAILVGIGLPQNEVLFYLPMLCIKGFAKEDFDEGVVFNYGIKHLDERRALVIVAETLNSYKVYLVTRPAMS